MNDVTNPSAARNSRLDEVIAAYLEAVAAGSSPDRQGLLDRHPDLATDLAAFFADHDRMRVVSAPLDAAAEAALPVRDPEDATLPPRTPDAVTLPSQATATEGATLPPAREKGVRTPFSHLTPFSQRPAPRSATSGIMSGGRRSRVAAWAASIRCGTHDR